MGLDMYLSRRHYVKRWSHQPKEEQFRLTVRRGGQKYDKINADNITYVEEEVMYWRKANAIHNWFVQNVQRGNDDCGTYDVSPKQLRELVELCERVIEGSKLVKGKIANGYKVEKNPITGKMEHVDILEDGEYIEDPSLAHRLLPTTSGFFFGSTDYDQWYLDDLKETVKTLKPILEQCEEYDDFQYHSSW